jgi:hypothetical protein
MSERPNLFALGLYEDGAPVICVDRGPLSLSSEQADTFAKKYGFSTSALSRALCAPAVDVELSRLLDDGREEVSRVLLSWDDAKEQAWRALVKDKATSSGKVGSKAEMQYLAAMMLEACWKGERLPPPSLRQLVRQILVQVESSRLLSAAKNDSARHVAARIAVEMFEPGERISREKLVSRLCVDDDRARRWLVEGFAELVEEYRREDRQAPDRTIFSPGSNFKDLRSFEEFWTGREMEGVGVWHGRPFVSKTDVEQTEES